MRTVHGALPFLALILASCASSGPYVWADQLPPTAAEAYRISIADRLTVVVQGQQQLSGEFEVLPTGGYIQPLVGEIMVLLSPAELGLAEAGARRAIKSGKQLDDIAG